MKMESIKAISWNVNGMNSAQKRKHIFHWLLKQKCNIIALQETHIKKTDVKYLLNKRIGEEFYSLAEKKKRGTVLYINKNLNPKKVYEDKQGRAIAVEITDQKRKILIFNLYAPNGTKNTFFQEIHSYLAGTNYEHIVLMGDFNGTTNNDIDRTTSSKKSKKRNKEGRLPESFFRLARDENLTDIWRKRNHGNRDYTYYSSRHKVWSRIDMIWVSKELDLLTNKIHILPRTISDHSPIIWKMRNVLSTRRMWRLNEDLLDKQDTVDKIKEEIKILF